MYSPEPVSLLHGLLPEDQAGNENFAYVYRTKRTQMNVSTELIFKTTRSGGKGGQNVNKVETAVLASFAIDQSQILSDTQQQTIKEKLQSRINSNGYLTVKSQTYRTQLENKEDAIKKINTLIAGALRKKKARIATKATRASVEKRITSKKLRSNLKEGRRKFRED